MLLHASAGDSEAWLVLADDVAKLTRSTPRLGSGRESPDVGVRGTWEDAS